MAEEKEKQSPIFKGNVLIILLIGVSFFAGYLWNRVKSLEEKAKTQPQTQGTQNQPQQPPPLTELKIAKPSTDEHWRGEKNVRFVWVEYTDLECPYCKRIHPDMIKLLDEYKGKIGWVFRHYPLPFHQNAQKEAEATECAAFLGGEEAFWKLTDKIFEKTTSNGTGFALSELAPSAQELGLDKQKFQPCLDAGKFEKKVKDQLEEGAKVGVRATPTGVIYDLKTGKTKVVEGALPYESLKSALDEFIKQQSG